MNDSLEKLIENKIELVALAIKQHEKGESAPLPLTVLVQISNELKEMKKNMNPAIYSPSYTKFILDWPDNEDGLLEQLSDIAYRYSKIKKKMK